MTRRYHPDRLDTAIEEYRAMKAEREADKAMRKNDMMIGLLCENMLEGRDPFMGFGQFWEGGSDA